ncbi:MAG: hypothetical protein N2438_03435, partial [Limisphaera sp.]|nr:hypothetical protein [Limisphaera sp.]
MEKPPPDRFGSRTRSVWISAWTGAAALGAFLLLAACRQTAPTDAAPPEVRFHDEPARGLLHVWIAGQPALTYVYGPEWDLP